MINIKTNKDFKQLYPIHVDSLSFSPIKAPGGKAPGVLMTPGSLAARGESKYIIICLMINL